jgi:type IV secretion system protein VirB10
MEDMRRQFDQEIAVLKASADTAGAADAAREAELAAKRAEREAQLAARVASPSVVFDDGQKGGAGDVGMGMPEAPAEGRDATGRDFVQSGREATATEVSQVIANPSNTVLQGTMIEATLENAVDSSLPGQITAIVTRPVWSFDQAQILIPAGARLFGDYSSDVAIGQGRILVAWTRLVTPDGQSVQMEASPARSTRASAHGSGRLRSFPFSGPLPLSPPRNTLTRSVPTQPRAWART